MREFIDGMNLKVENSTDSGNESSSPKDKKRKLETDSACNASTSLEAENKKLKKRESRNINSIRAI